MASTQWPDPLNRFKEVHELICRYPFAVHVPTLLTLELNKYPEAITFIRRETNEGRMAPQYHGQLHIDYADLTVEAILRDYKEGQEWFERHLGCKFDTHYTPWAAGFAGSKRGPHIQTAADIAKVRLVATKKLLEPEHIIDDADATKTKYGGQEIFIHWWAGIGKLEKALNKLRDSNGP